VVANEEYLLAHLTPVTRLNFAGVLILVFPVFSEYVTNVCGMITLDVKTQGL
jgi:hypothetical protein